MSYLNSIYRAIKDFREQISEDKELCALFDAVKRASRDDDKLEAERSYCIVEEDWVDKIEKELVFVAKAIEEDRQFIIQNGEVLPIEKVRKVSNASVRHLAKHSNQITREPEEGEDILPEKLYMVENLTDFAVYENRFLYMLLCYLRDFINLRLGEILEVGSTYRAKMVVKKEISIKKRRITLSTELFDEDKNDPLSEIFSKSAPIIGRIQNAAHLVSSLLMTPLMREVSKVPMIKPPITKTNVLRMNNNFIHAMDLYHFLTSYNKKGYRVEKIKRSIIPLTDEIIDELTAVFALKVFLEYKHGNKLEESLKQDFEKENEQIAIDKETEILNKLAILREKAKSSGLDEYILALEDRNKSLESVNNRLKETKVKLEDALNELKECDIQKAQLEKSVEFYKKEVDDKLLRLNETEYLCEEKIRALEEEKNAVLDEYQSKVGDLNSHILAGVEKERANWEENAKVSLSLREAELDQKYQQKTVELEQKASESIADSENRIKQEKSKHDLEILELKNQLENANKTISKLSEEKSWAMAQLNGLRAQNNLIGDTEDYTSMERFIELEQQFDAFSKFFKSQWSKTKKRIRREILWKKKKDNPDDKN
ncbi:MAG: DUF2357 domain-containing protein [Clostridia bacterium]|nr:DUF2357 domain-containing protein [Clostridia bacterium]